MKLQNIYLDTTTNILVVDVIILLSPCREILSSHLPLMTVQFCAISYRISTRILKVCYRMSEHNIMMIMLKRSVQHVSQKFLTRNKQTHTENDHSLKKSQSCN